MPPKTAPIKRPGHGRAGLAGREFSSLEMAESMKPRISRSKAVHGVADSRAHGVLSSCIRLTSVGAAGAAMPATAPVVCVVTGESLERRRTWCACRPAFAEKQTLLGAQDQRAGTAACVSIPEVQRARKRSLRGLSGWSIMAARTALISAGRENQCGAMSPL